MRDLYSSHAAALRDALSHVVERGGMSSLGVLHQGRTIVRHAHGHRCNGAGGAHPSPARTARARAPCATRHCLRAAHAEMQLPRGQLSESRMGRCDARGARARRAIAHQSRRQRGATPRDHCGRADALTRTRETAVSLAERCGVNRHTVAAHVAIIETDLIGNRQAPGRLDAASTRIDALLREAGIVADASNDAAHVQAA